MTIRPDTSDLLGSIIDSRYEIIDLLGEGAMGSVYRAKHLGIGRLVAVKLLHPNVGSMPDLAARFDREALATGKVNHPNCVTASDSGLLADGTRYLVMELLDGPSLAELLEEQSQLSVSRSLHIVQHVLRGLAHVHSAGVIHRDLKPDNIVIVEKDGDDSFAKILDFGIAKMVGESASAVDEKPLTQLGVAFGTPWYMSPEQAVGKQVDTRTDLYSLSIILFEMLTGRPPFDGDDAMTILPMHMTCDVPRIADIAPDIDVPRLVEQIIRRGLAKRPGDRFQDARSYLAAINQALDADWFAEQTPRPASRTAAAPAIQQLAARAPTAPGIPRSRATVPAVYSPPPQATARPTLAPTLAPTVGAPTLAPTVTIGKSRLVLLVGALVVVFATLLVVLLLRSGGKSPAGDDNSSFNVVHEARVMFRGGHAKAAIALLEAKPAIVARDPQAQLLLGHAYSVRKRHRNAMVIYHRVVTNDPATGTDKLLRKNLTSQLASSPRRVKSKAFALLETIIVATNDDSAKQQLVAFASGYKLPWTRSRAFALAEKLQLGKLIDRLKSHTLDLTTSSPCSQRKKAVAKLRALGDKRAIAALNKSRTRWRKRRGNTNACLRKEAEEAITYIKSLP